MKGENEMIICEEQMKVIVLDWLDKKMYGHNSKVVSVSQSRTTKKFSIKLESKTKTPFDDGDQTA